MGCWYWNHTSCSDFLVTLLKPSLSFSLISLHSFTHSFFIFFSFFKPAIYKECELPPPQTKQRLDQMWPAICWMGNKHEESSHLPSVDAESSRACLAFRQGSPAGKLKEKKHLFHFSPVLTWQLLWARWRGKEDVLPWDSESLYLSVGAQ